MRIHAFCFSLAFIFGIFGFPFISHAASMGLIIAPTQVIFTPKATVMTMSVTNRSEKRMAHKLYLSDETMDSTGAVSAQIPNPYSARRILRFTPDALDLAPGEGQVIRLLARRPIDLPAGDYHSHIIFEELPFTPPVIGKTAISSTTPQEDGGGSAKFGITTLLTIGIPVIVQNGAISSSLTLKGMLPVQPRLGNGNYPPYQFQLQRQGNATARGYLTLRNPQGADLITPRSVSVYREVDEVTLTSARTPTAYTYKGPALLRLTASAKKDAPELGKLNVNIQ